MPVDLDDAQFSELLEREASPVEGQSLQQKFKIRKEEIVKANNKIIKKKNEKFKYVGHLLVQKLLNLISAHARAKMS